MTLKRPAFDTLVNDYKDLITLARKKFRTEQPESSKGSVKFDFSHTIFYESFENYPISLEANLKVYPKRWALAFLQSDIKSIALILCESVFIQEDLNKRDSSTLGAKALPDVKKIAIQRAAKWLMNKNQDPWSYKPGLWPTVEEKKAIEEAFETFNFIDPYNANNPTKPEESEESDDAMDEGQVVDLNVVDVSPEPPNNPVENDVQIMTSIVEQQAFPSPPTSPTSVDLDNKYEEILEDLTFHFEYCTAFDKVIKLSKSGERSSLGNTAQTAKFLTRMVIPENDDIFVDAVQFSIQRFACAIQGTTLEDIVDPLFRKYYKVDFVFKDITFKSLDDVSPPKVLALLRAVAWIKKLQEGWFDDSFGLDSSIKEHNVYLTLIEINRIYNYLSSKYGNGNCRPTEGAISITRDTPPPTPPSTSANTTTPSICVVSPTPINDSTTVTNKSVPTTIVSPPSPSLIQQLSSIGQQGNVIIRGCTFSSVCWNEGLRRFKSEEKSGAEKAGKYLFEETFTAKEILERNMSGRGDKEQFSSNKVDAILDALEYMKALLFGQGRIISWTKSERKELSTKIFIEHSNYLRRKLKENDNLRLRMAQTQQNEQN